MIHSIGIKKRGIFLRQKGYSFQEISEILKIAKSTASLWLRSVKLNSAAKERLETRRQFGRERLIKIIKEKQLLIHKEINDKSKNLVSSINYDKKLKKLLCAILYWAEGEKNRNAVVFVNSNPLMVKSFLNLFRGSFYVDGTKMRALVHIHEYHDDNEIKRYWSNITKIPLTLFNKSYLKPNTKQRIRKGYKGTISIRYHDSRIAKELNMIYNIFAEIIGV